MKWHDSSPERVDGVPRSQGDRMRWHDRENRNRRALILGWAYYLDAFSSYPLCTWLPSVYRGHDNWYTRGASFPVLSY
ncbi:hypothetical protein N665_0160s0005 [Sinapis alba]|nr:hypothetical protein N665_0160s0005 [Sinapis alba]